MSIWFKCDARFHKDPKMLALPSDTSRYAFLMLIGEAKYLRSGGVFETRLHLEACLPAAYWPAVDELIEAGLLVKRGKKKIAIRSWKQWQVDPTSAERSRRARSATAEQRPSNGTATAPQRGRVREESESERENSIRLQQRRNVSNGKVEPLADIIRRQVKK
jgi:hypothetical protein